MDVHVGAEVGFATRFDKLRHDRTELLYMTDRTLLEVAGKQPNFNDFARIIIDEAHERALATDMLLGLLRVAISQRTDLKVVVMLATSDAQRFIDYFGDKKATRFELTNLCVALKYWLLPLSMDPTSTCDHMESDTMLILPDNHLAQPHAFHAYIHTKQRTSPELPDKERVDLDIRQWCFDAFLNHSVLDEVARVRQQLKEQFHLLCPDWRAPNTTPFIDPNYEINIRKALARTFYYRSAFRDPAGIDQYRVVRANWQAGIHPDGHQELDFFRENNWLRKPNGAYRMPILQTTILPLQPKKDPKNTPE
ncbi:uncharacterized protein FMAN_16053 [Fusarium mangiferae]|uniref:Helicase ATP-binding domain-containing protein n=1 Tax=Fusarium mangiferae TaxID=192010 RepID=A0A1L7SUN4_FUSMA|nr:uncharacterized protein FMAN_16053 [Fusarium mangiferae]CVK86926.1 uncharacterized protein FMAN_16053 [Fusarium mangiferae]